jgi:hypothetical protein
LGEEGFYGNFSATYLPYLKFLVNQFGLDEENARKFPTYAIACSCQETSIVVHSDLHLERLIYITYPKDYKEKTETISWMDQLGELCPF